MTRRAQSDHAQGLAQLRALAETAAGQDALEARTETIEKADRLHQAQQRHFLAQDLWQSQLLHRPDPAQLQLSAAWLVAQQRHVNEANLVHDAAQSREQHALARYSRAVAERRVADEIAREARRDLLRYEARQTDDAAADLILARKVR
jgi:hypothetical protein